MQGRESVEASSNASNVVDEWLKKHGGERAEESVEKLQPLPVVRSVKYGGQSAQKVVEQARKRKSTEDGAGEEKEQKENEEKDNKDSKTASVKKKKTVGWKMTIEAHPIVSAQDKKKNKKKKKQ